MSNHTLEGGEKLVNVHAAYKCLGTHCPIHNLSDHRMRHFPQHFNQGRVERTCPHDIGHPDPDDRTPFSTAHGCDGCCQPPPLPDFQDRDAVESWLSDE